MDIEKYIFEDYIICPICKAKKRALTWMHLGMHGYESVREFKIKNNIPLGVALLSHETQRNSRNRAMKNAEWFKEEVVPKGIQLAKELRAPLPKESLEHARRMKKGKSWTRAYKEQMKEEGWISLSDAVSGLGQRNGWKSGDCYSRKIKRSTSKDEAKNLIRFIYPNSC
ncbi:hypothetical protein [Thermoactinomyces sp. DSM 45892]|uniref:hypothetical protein n=1 Tax=Thermoactinomyces sp. DSM 45892 TaxID=1882753 RepID=UPI000898790D|nr:hypothetical protein [Thermoactinomyces sp. DSM 45892]SDY22009.1 hypothetical protein SAMN05444416_10313 [Thermoactinomyces sp. DSM 45892]